MFAMLAALESGLPLDTGFDAPTRLVTGWTIDTPGKNNCDGKWCVENADPGWMDGHRTMWDGFGRSVNTYWVWLHERIGEHLLGVAARADRRPADRRNGQAPGHQDQ
jgi:hypothetical protein